MIDIAQSPFLQALGLAIANSLWQAALLWLLCFVCNSVVKPKANQKYLLATSAALLSLLWFVYNVGFYYWKITTLLTSDIQNDNTSFDFTSTYIFTNGFRYAQVLIPYLSCAYMLVTALLAVRLFNGFKEIKTLRYMQLHKAPVAWRVFVKNYAAILQISKPVEVWLSEHVNSPLTIGFWKPIILLPLASMNHLSPKQVEAILLHELSHIRRYDYLVNILLQIAEILLFFNPFVRLLLKQAYQERENSCDDWVLQFNYSGADYARALLSIQQTAHTHMLALGANNHGSYFLLNRIKRIISPEKKSTDYRTQLSTLAFVMLTLLIVNTFVPAITAKQYAPKTMAITNADFFASDSQIGNSAINRIENAAQAFSIGRIEAAKQMRPASQKKSATKPGYDKNAVINMVTEEEEIALAEIPVFEGPTFLNDVLSDASLVENKKSEQTYDVQKANIIADNAQKQYFEILQGRIEEVQKAIRQNLSVVEEENKTIQAVGAGIHEKLKMYELELQALYAAIPNEFRKNLTNEFLHARLFEQETLFETVAEKYEAVAQNFTGKGYSFSYNTTTPDAMERNGGIESVNAASAVGRKINASRTYHVTRSSIVQSKDNRQVTIRLRNPDNEISICLPSDTNEATFETLKQLENAGVLIIEHKNNVHTKPAIPKKSRVIVSL